MNILFHTKSWNIFIFFSRWAPTILQEGSPWPLSQIWRRDKKCRGAYKYELSKVGRHTFWVGSLPKRAQRWEDSQDKGVPGAPLRTTHSWTKEPSTGVDFQIDRDYPDEVNQIEILEAIPIIVSYLSRFWTFGECHSWYLPLCSLWFTGIIKGNGFLHWCCTKSHCKLFE